MKEKKGIPSNDKNTRSIRLSGHPMATASIRQSFWDANERTMIGADETECIEGFYGACDDLIDSLKFRKIREMRAAGESEFAVALMCNSFTIFKVASRDTAEWQDYKDRMKPIFDELGASDRVSRR